MDNTEAINLFRKLVAEDKCPDDSLEVKHIDRGYHIEQPSPGIFEISIERHPHLFRRPSIGKASSAFATVKRIYEFIPVNGSIEFVKKNLVDIEIDYYALAMEDFSGEAIDGLFYGEIDNELKNLKSEDAVKDFALKQFVFFCTDELLDKFLITEYELPSDFLENYKEAAGEVFTDSVLKQWEFLKNF